MSTNDTHHIGFLRGNPFTSAHAAFAEHIKSEADKEGASHSVILSGSHDAKKNPLTPEQKLKHAKRAAPEVNISSATKSSPTILHHASNAYAKGARNLVVHASSDRAPEFKKLLTTYNGKEGKHGHYKFKNIDVRQFGGERTEGGKGMEGVSATKMRGFASSGSAAGKKSFFKMAPSKMSDAHKEEMWNDTRKGMQMESTTPVGIFLLGGPGSGKDYVLKNIFSRFDLTEVQSDQILSGSASSLYENKNNIVINGALDEEKIAVIKNILEGYEFDYVHVSVTNKVSRIRNEQREQPLSETKRIEKFLSAEKLAEKYDCFHFNNSINLNESTEFEKVFFASQIEKLLERVVGLGLEIQTDSEPKAFSIIKEKYFPPIKHHKSGLPSKYVAGLKPSEIAAKRAAIKRNAKLSDRDPAAYKDMPGDKRIRAKGIPVSKYTKQYHAMYGEEKEPAGQKSHLTVDKIAEKHGVSPAEILKQLEMGREVEHEHTKDHDLATDIALNHLGEIPDYYTRLASMEKKGKAANEQVSPEVTAHQEKEEQKRRIRDTRVIHHQNRHVHKAAIGEEVIDEGASDTSLAAKSKKSGISVGTLRKVYNRGVAAWNSGHRPGTTPAQWGHARVNSYITKGKTYHTADKDLHEEEQLDELLGLTMTKSKPKKKPMDFKAAREFFAKLDTQTRVAPLNPNLHRTVGEEVEESLDALFERQLIGTDEYRQHAIAMTPGQTDDIQNAYPVKDPSENISKDKSDSDCGCSDGCDCHETNESVGVGAEPSVRKSFSAIRQEAKEVGPVDLAPVIDTKAGKKARNQVTSPKTYDSTMHGLPVASRFNAYEAVHPQEQPEFPTQKRSWVMAKGSRKVGPQGQTAVAHHNEEVSLDEAVQYHLDNNISITENIFRPGSDMFFQLIGEAKRLYKEGKYTPADEYEKDLLESDIGEVAEYEGQLVVLDYPVIEGLQEACWSGYTQKGMKKKGDKMVPNCVPEEVQVNEEEGSDPTGGHGIGKPFRSGGGGAVYVRSSDGGVRKVNFSQSGMKKRYNEPGRVKSFVARHHCLTNKDKTSASYWACRWPRYFSNTGQTWW